MEHTPSGGFFAEDVHRFTSLDLAKVLIEAWQIDYDEHRPTDPSGT